MTPTQQNARQRQQRAEELAAATLRALAGDARLEFRGGHLCRDARPLPILAPHLRLDTEASEFGECRGLADGVALRLQHSDAVAFAAADGSIAIATLADPLGLSLEEKIKKIRMRKGKAAARCVGCRAMTG